MDALFTVDRVSSPDREERLIGSGEVARRLGVAPSTVASWVRQGWITPAVRTAGGRLRFRFSDVERQLRERGQGV
jgi:excisionase family DNA binding protein